ncbi:MAG: hypothetical protein R3B49_06210 [Phycisphaerales bacterium]
MTARARTLTLVLIAGTLAGGAPGLRAQDLDNARLPAPGSPAGEALDPAAQALLEAPYLSDDERRDLRIFFGVWTPDDLDTPARLARAALVVGVYDHPALADDAADPGDRAEAALHRGEPERALEILAGDGSVRGARLRAQALFDLGRYQEAAGAVGPVIDKLARRQTESADEIAEAVRALNIRSRIVGSELGDGGDFRQMMQLLARARDELDRLDWRVRLAEAEVLYEKHNRAEALAAAREVLGLNHRCAEAMAMVANLAVDGFDFDTMNQLVWALDTLTTPAGPLGDRAPAHGEGSAEARLVEARAWLRQRNTDEARLALAPVRAQYPGRRDALALEAAAAAVAARPEEAADLLERLDELSPGSGEGQLVVGRALAEARQYDLAPAYLERAAAALPKWSTPAMELGLMELQAGEDARAIEHLAAATALDPFNARANNSLAMARELTTFATIETPHFVVRYKSGIDEVLARDMPAVLERLHDRVTGNGVGGIDHEPGARTIIDLMPDHAFFAVRITGMPDLWTIAASTGPLIAMEPPREGPGKKTGPYDWARVLQHEYTHTVTLSRSHNRIPHWMTEGMSVVLEDSPKDARTWGLLAGAWREGELFDLRAINVAFVRPKRPEDRSLAYAQAAWMIQFFNERFGPETPRKILDELARGATDAEAFERVLGMPEAAWFTDFVAWAHQELVEAGALLPAGEPTFEELCERDGVDPAVAFADAGRLDAWLGSYPEHPGVLACRASVMLRTLGGRPDGSMVPMLERWAAAAPGDDQPRRLLARIYLSSDNPKERAKAVASLEYLDAREQSTPAYASELARLHAAAGELEAAPRGAERAAMIAPYDADEREFAARVAIQSGHLDDAERHIEALTVLEPDRPRHQERLEAIKRMIEQRGG